MKRFWRYLLLMTFMSLILVACGKSDEESKQFTTTDITSVSKSVSNIVDSKSSETDNSRETTTKDNKKETTNKQSEENSKEASAEETELSLEDETIELIPETTQEITTAYVESGETNENGVVDGQQVGPVETVATVAASNGGIVSDKPYLIKVNRQANCVTIYSKDADGQYTVPVKAMVCSCGRAGMETPLGTFQLMMRYQWRELYGNVYGYYSTRIVGSILFHSVPYTSPSPNCLENWEYDKLGSVASQGCIRLQVKDSKWIFDNCATGTYVIIYDSADPGPLGKPEATKIGNAAGVYYGWDPTDTTSGNPYNICSNWITLKASEVKCNTGDDLDIEAFATGYDTSGNGVEVTVSGNVDFSKAGEYKVVYSVTDSLGRTYSAYIIFNVQGDDIEETSEDESSENECSEDDTTDTEFTKESTEKETTIKETTAKETTAKETTAKETTAKETTAKETTAKETTAKETTARETTVAPTTTVTPSTTVAPTTTETATSTVAPTTTEEATTTVEITIPETPTTTTVPETPAPSTEEVTTAEIVNTEADPEVTTLAYDE